MLNCLSSCKSEVTSFLTIQDKVNRNTSPASRRDRCTSHAAVFALTIPIFVTISSPANFFFTVALFESHKLCCSDATGNKPACLRGSVVASQTVKQYVEKKIESFNTTIPTSVAISADKRY